MKYKTHRQNNELDTVHSYISQIYEFALIYAVKIKHFHTHTLVDIQINTKVAKVIAKKILEVFTHSASINCLKIIACFMIIALNSLHCTPIDSNCLVFYLSMG